jgi:hypothetical protein
MQRICFIYHVVLTECQTKYVEEPQIGRSVLTRARYSLGESVFTGPRGS